MFAPRVVGLVFFLLTAGCVGAERAPPRELPVATAQGGAADVAPLVLPATKTPPNAPASSATAKQPPKKESAVQAPGKEKPSPPLDLASLEQRLRDTKAIGVFTKISLKNQVDDLLTQFRAFHQGRAGAVLTDLREQYNLLLLKVLSLLQGSDPVLAQAIAASREALWGLLADPAKFATLT